MRTLAYLLVLIALAVSNPCSVSELVGPKGG
jgi:hypothetical protein